MLLRLSLTISRERKPPKINHIGTDFIASRLQNMLVSRRGAKTQRRSLRKIPKGHRKAISPHQPDSKNQAFSESGSARPYVRPENQFSIRTPGLTLTAGEGEELLRGVPNVLRDASAP
jgi:hypothetical protein